MCVTISVFILCAGLLSESYFVVGWIAAPTTSCAHTQQWQAVRPQQISSWMTTRIADSSPSRFHPTGSATAEKSPFALQFNPLTELRSSSNSNSVTADPVNLPSTGVAAPSSNSSIDAAVPMTVQDTSDINNSNYSNYSRNSKNSDTKPTDTSASTTTGVRDSATEANDEEDEYEYIEYEILTESEFIGSEWLVGTNWNDKPNDIDETWARLIVDSTTGKNVAVWGDNSQGTWALDVASQFLSISKENTLTGKDIWACTVTDYYYLQGTVRGWKYWLPAAVLGQWQARRLNVDPDEAGIAPWFQTQ